jgi:hypothetical protein
VKRFSALRIHRYGGLFIEGISTGSYVLQNDEGQNDEGME